jgi:YggT family protein
MDQALRLVLDTVFGLFTYAFLLRFVMQWQRAPFRNPVGQAVVALTDWAVAPLRRVLPAFGRQDGATLVLAFVGQFLWLLAAAFLFGRGPVTGGAVLSLLLLAPIALLRAAIWIAIVAIIVQAVLSWTAPHGPLAGFLNAMTFRLLAPIRRVVPPVGGTLDLSPLIAIVLLQVVLMVPIPWLEAAVLGIAR